MPIQIVPQLLPAQAEFFYDYQTPHLAFVAGYGSGKTLTMAYKCLQLAALNIGFQGAAMEPIIPMIRRNLMPAFYKVFDLHKINYHYAKANGLITINWSRSQKSYIHLLAAENYDRAAGLNLAWACCDEMDKIKYDEAVASWQMIQSRLRDGNVFQLCAVSTPEGHNFMYDYFVKNAIDHDNTVRTDRRMVHMRSFDNPYLPESYFETILANYPENLARAYLNGEFVNLNSGRVYYAFDKDENNHNKTLADFPADTPLCIGVDFNVDQMAAIVCVATNDGGKKTVYVIDELLKDLNTEALVDTITRLYPGRRIYLFPDAAGGQRSANSPVTSLEILRRIPNSQIRALSRDPPVMDRVNSVNAMLCTAKKERRLFVNTKRCPRLTEALELQGFVNGAPDKDKRRALDHPVDALGYFIYTAYPLQGTPSVRQLY